jgi:antitoxin ChpS
MHITNLRKVGGSVMLAVPPALLELLHLKAGAQVGVAVNEGRLIVEAAAKQRYTLAELLETVDDLKAKSDRDREWLDGSPVGKELL